jgi:hypothetical protein
MNVDRLFLTVYAQDFERLVEWWTLVLGAPPSRSPVPNCREWDLTDNALLQVIHHPGEEAKLTLSARIKGLSEEIERLRGRGLAVPEPTQVPGFDALLWTQFFDPEGNRINLLEGA